MSSHEKSTSSDTFQTGQRVIFQEGKGNRWFEGIVTGRIKGTNCYSVEKEAHLGHVRKDGGEEIKSYSEDLIKPLDDEYQFARSIFQPRSHIFPDRDLHDPLAHLYMDKEYLIQDFPNDLWRRGLDEETVKIFLYGRRRTEMSSTLHKSAKELLDDLRGDVDIEELKASAKSKLQSLLRLVDLKTFGLLEENSAGPQECYSLYFQAARGVPYEAQNLESFRFAYPIGPPEALCALAQWDWLNLCFAAGNDRTTPSSVIEWAQSSGCSLEHKIELRQVIFMYSHAIRRDWVCPHAISLAKAMNQMKNLVFDENWLPFRESVYLFWAANIRRREENGFATTDLAKLGLPYNDPRRLGETPPPSSRQLEMFAPKATDIFLALPVVQFTPDGFSSSDLHIEYFLVEDTTPHGLQVIVMNPESCEIGFFVPITSTRLEKIPYSQTAFEEVWTKLAFTLHMGDGKGNYRQRPKLITFADRHGDRKLATFIRDKIGSDNRTEIKVVNTKRYKIKYGKTGRHKVEIPDRDFSLLGILTKVTTFSTMMPLHKVSETFSMIDKTLGYRYLNEGKFFDARKVFSESIYVIRGLSKMDSATYQLLGFLLIGNLASLLGISSECTNPLSLRYALEHGIEDCIAARSFITDDQRECLEKQIVAAEDIVESFGGHNEEIFRPIYAPHDTRDTELVAIAAAGITSPTSVAEGSTSPISITEGSTAKGKKEMQWEEDGWKEDKRAESAERTTQGIPKPKFQIGQRVLLTREMLESAEKGASTITVTEDSLKALPPETSFVMENDLKSRMSPAPFHFSYKDLHSRSILEKKYAPHPVECLHKMAHYIVLRRKFQKGGSINWTHFYVKKILDSLVMDENVNVNVEQLKESAESDFHSLLRLADLKHFQLCGQYGTKEEIYPMYVRAAWGHEIVLDERLPPTGPPEALCALAQLHWNEICSEFSTENGIPGDVKEVFEWLCSEQCDSHLKAQMRMIITMYGHAVRREWLCHQAMDIGRVIIINQYSKEGHKPNNPLDPEMIPVNEELLIDLCTAACQHDDEFLSRVREIMPTPVTEPQRVEQSECHRRRRHNKKNGSRRNRQKQRRQARKRTMMTQEEDASETDGLEVEQPKETHEASRGIAQELCEEMISFIFGRDLTTAQIAACVHSPGDPCPICIDRFDAELSDVHTAVLSCGHAVCMSCLSGLHKKVQTTMNSSTATVFTCPSCRHPIPNDVLSMAVGPVVAQTPSLHGRVNALPLSESDSVGVTESLLVEHDFAVTKVIRDLDSMLVDHMQSAVRQVTSWSPKQKQQIYEEARKPVDVLFLRFDEVHRRLARIQNMKSNQVTKLLRELHNLQDVQIPQAREKASRDIWAKMNSAGTMGGENEEGEVELDFHALHVNEARNQFDKRVLPILKAVKTVLLIVGQGTHSEGKKSKLKPALQKHIDKHEKRDNLRYSGVESNPGAIRVHWKE